MRKAVLFCIMLLVFFSCSRGKKITRTDTTTSGVARFVSDDCFARIAQEEADVFEATYKEAYLLPEYINEIDAINLLLKDSVRMAILARDLTDAEKQGIKDRNPQLIARSRKIAIDGIALIVHRDNADSLISIPTIEKIVSGEITSWKEINPESNLEKLTVVFDNPNSSTVRFVRDSIAGGHQLYEGLNAQENNQAVLEYVAKTPNALGIIGVNWISNPNDTTNLTFTGDVRVMHVSKTHPANVDNAYPPLPAFLALGDYPLRRDVYIVLTDLRGTLLSGFLNFIAGDTGQRIILKSGLVPATRPIRLITVKEEF